MITGEIKNKINGIWDIFWSAGLTNPLTVIEQVTYLMFIKILDDNELRKEATAAAFDLEIENPIFDAEHQDCRWSNFRHMSPDEMFDNMIQKVFPFIKTGLTDGKDTAFARYMKDALFQVPTAKVLVKVVDALDDLDLNNKDIMGDVYEYLLSQIEQSGKNGQFRTPRHIIQMMVELMKPTLQDKICDPAMGSAGFITESAKYINEKYSKELMVSSNKAHYTITMFSGFDTDPTMLRIGAMNMMLHGVEAPNIKWQDSVSEDNTIKDEFSLILANPPFSGSVDKTGVAKDLLQMTSTTKTELLFLALFTRMLKIGGRCASIVPDGVLFGSSNAHKSIRKEIVDNHRLEAVISMPSGVFQPYAGVKTSIVIFTKTNHGGTDNVWFYDMLNDGKTLDVKRSPIEGSNIPDIIERFHNLENEKDRTRKDQSFFVPVSEIRDNDYDLTINKYKEVEKEVKVYRPVSEISADIETTQNEMIEAFAELKRMLGE